MHYVSAYVTHPGLQRDNNEDAVLADDQKRIWLVADGMGGHAGGEVASRLAVDTIYQRLCTGAALVEAIEQAHDAILKRAEAEPELAGMGTTIVAAKSEGRRLQLAWVGDSRLYLMEAGELRQLSVDHSFVQDMVERGVITDEEAARHPQKNLIRQALGQTQGRSLQVDQLSIKLKPTQQLILCTDGVHDMLNAQDIAQALSKPDLEKQMDALQSAVLATAAADNFTAVVVRCEAGVWHKRLFPWTARKTP